MDYANAKKKKEKVDEIIYRTKQTVSIKDNNLLMINPKKMDEIILISRIVEIAISHLQCLSKIFVLNVIG